MGFSDARRIVVIALIIAITFIGFLLLNVQFRIGFIYLILGVLSVFVILQFEKLVKDPALLERANSDTGKPFWMDISMGFLIGALYFFTVSVLPSLAVFAPQQGLAIPVLPLATGEQWATIGGVAPIIEEIFFRGMVLAVLVLGLHVPFWLANGGQAVGFGGYHTYTYAGSLDLGSIAAVSGALLITTGLGFVAGILVRNKDGTVNFKKLLVSIPFHQAFNIFILSFVGTAGTSALIAVV